ncbi:hypothetical protein [Pseudomonas sp.]|uniref:hypothetical protein n=1 Tax=Pseudomonas sp. TaxID=306 RepID=UPI002584224D|nr:hypothetical protein [Pseudomonas sp.]
MKTNIFIVVICFLAVGIKLSHSVGYFLGFVFFALLAAGLALAVSYRPKEKVKADKKKVVKREVVEVVEDKAKLQDIREQFKEVVERHESL